MSYDPELITSFFDAYGMQEHERLVSSPKNFMSLVIHQHYLKQYLSPDSKVLELGAGSGRFSVFMAQLGLQLLVSDISQVQLDLARKHVEEAKLSEQVDEYRILDITDLSSLDDNSYDHTVAIGGPLSYVFEQKGKAMQEMIRVTRPGGLIILGVMSRYGAMQRVLRAYIPDLMAGNYTVKEVFKTGDDFGYLAFEGHHSHLFTYKEIKEFLADYPVEVIDATATSYLTTQRAEGLYDIVKNDKAWAQLVELELEICKKMIDGGSHMLIVVKKH